MLALQIGSLLGFALARTWPTRPERLDTWIDGATAYSDIEHLPLSRPQLKLRERERSPGEPPDFTISPACRRYRLGIVMSL